MKRQILVLITFIITNAAFAQSQNQHAYSVGFRVLGVSEYAKLMNESRTSASYKTNKLNGLIFKFNDNQISYRIQGTYYKEDDYSFRNNCKTCEEVNGNFKEFSLKIGFEKNIIYGAVQPFWGADFGSKMITFDGTAYDVTSGGKLYDVTVEKNGAVIYPFLGLKANFFSGQLTLSAEAGLDILFSNDKEVKTYAENSFTQDDFYRWGFYNKPLGMLSIQYNFGEN